MSYQTYDAYTDSGLQWLGDIPSHWEVVQSRRLFEQRKERARFDDEQLTASQKYGIIYQKNFMELESQRVVQVITGSEILKHVEPNDFVISMRSFQGGLEWCRYHGSVSSAYLGLIPIKHVVPEFFRYLFKSSPYIQALQSTSNLVRDGQALRFDNFSQVWLPIVPEDEQKQIANFLDHETKKIDTLIEKQQQLIKLLKEKRQAVISHAVTKGLNSDVPMKDSGVEWLGEVPEHWGVSSLGYYADISTGATPDRSKQEYWDGDIPWIKTGEVKYSDIIETEEFITKKGSENSAVTISPPGTLLMAMYGQGVTRGRVAILGIAATYNQACAAITPNEKIWNQYLRYFFMAAYHAIRDGGNETSQMNLNADIVSKLKVTIPKINEQHEIVKYLDVELEVFDKLNIKANDVIELLQERRTTLISAAVTGKINVQNWQAPA